MGCPLIDLHVLFPRPVEIVPCGEARVSLADRKIKVRGIGKCKLETTQLNSTEPGEPPSLRKEPSSSQNTALHWAKTSFKRVFRGPEDCRDWPVNHIERRSPLQCVFGQIAYHRHCNPPGCKIRLMAGTRFGSSISTGCPCGRVLLDPATLEV